MEDEVFAAKLAAVRAVFPGRLAVPASLGAEACGIAGKTFRNRLTAGDAPFTTFKIGDRRLVEVVELARFLARQTSPAAPPAVPAQARGLVGGEPARGRPRREEEAAAAAVGLSVREFRAAQRAKIAAVEVQK